MSRERAERRGQEAGDFEDEAPREETDTLEVEAAPAFDQPTLTQEDLAYQHWLDLEQTVQTVELADYTEAAAEFAVYHRVLVEAVEETEALDDYGDPLLDENGRPVLEPAVYNDATWAYLVFGLIEEFAEYGAVGHGNKEAAVAEAGDVFWYASQLAAMLGSTLTVRTGMERGRPFAELVGSLAGLAKKGIRDELGQISDARRAAFVAAANDVASYVTHDLRFRLGLVLQPQWLETTVEQVAAGNLTKLRDRQRRNVIHGSGDKR